jgi:hypothetical protein
MRALAERERQLRDLTEQALGFLEELAESRRINRDRDQIAARVGELERTLADARARLRHAGIGREQSDGAFPPLEIVCWGEGARERAAAVQAADPSRPVLWIALPEDAPPSGSGPPALIHRNARSPAQCFNLGMAATHGACVLFLGPGVTVAADLPVPRSAAQPNAALLCPRVLRGDGEELGCAETDDLMHLRSLPAVADRGQDLVVPLPQADAFLLRRAAFEHAGLFDEALAGPATLIDYVFRARARNLEVLAATDCTVTAARAALLPDDAERLRLLARHRPAVLGRALASTDLLWQLEPEAARGLLQQLLAELPPGDHASAQRAALDAIALGLVAHAMPQEQLATRLQAIRISLLESVARSDFAAGRDEAVAELAGARAAGVPAAGLLAGLQRDLDLDRRVRAAMLAALAAEQSERRRLDGEFHAQLARAERADGAAMAARARLDQREDEFRRLEQEFTTLRDAQAAGERLLHACQRRLAEAEHALEASNRQRAEGERALEASAHREAELDRALTASMRSQDEGERRLQTTDAELRSQREQLAERERWIALLLREVGRRRMFPRRLLEHELELLRRTGQQP